MSSIYFDSFLKETLAVFLAILCIGVAYFKYSFTYWKKKNVPSLPARIPFGNFGPLLLQKATPGENIKNLYYMAKSTGARYVGVYLITKPVLIILDPELARNVMSKDFPHFYARISYCDEETNPLSGHLVSLSGVKWRNLRSKLTPTFTSGKIKQMFPTLLSCCDELEVLLDDHVKSGQPFDIKDTTGRFTTDIIGSCAFGINCNTLKEPNSIFRIHGKRVFELTPFEAFKFVFANHFPKTFKMLKLKLLPNYVTDFFHDIVRDTVEYRENNNITRQDFMQLLIQLKNKGTIEDGEENVEPGTRLTLQELTAQVFVFFLAGFETSSTTMSFFMYDMAIHQDIQDKVRKEINEVIQRHDGKITYDAVLEMHYLEKVIYESMRQHASIPTLSRRCTKDYPIPDSDVVIDKGTTVIMPMYGYQSDPKYFPNPEVFDPERFSPEEKVKRHPYAFLPFGEGPRICIGLRFGLLQTKLGLIILLKNHKFTLNSKTQTPIKMDPKCAIFSVVGGIWLNAEKV